MQNQSSSIPSITPSANQSLILRYVLEPINRIALALLWSTTTTSATLTTLLVFLNIVERAIPNFARLWAASFPTSVVDFPGTPIGIIIVCTGALCWINIYSVKQTKRAYQELHVCVISIRISLPERNGERRIFTLRHLTVIWGNARETLPSFLRLFSIAVLQSLALLWQRAHQDQPVSASGTLSVIADSQTTAAVMTVLSEEKSSASDVCTPTREDASVASGIFGTVLKVCQIRIVGPSGAEKVVDVQHRPYLLLWLYLVALSITQQWINVDDILRDVYGYDECAGGDGEKEAKEEREKRLDQFHDHHRVLRKDINKALVEVGLPKTTILQNERRTGTSFWRLAATVHVSDLALFERCRTLLTSVAEAHEDDMQLHEQVVTACERFSVVVGDMATIKPYHETPGIQKLLREILMTYTKALKYLAHENRVAVQKTTDAQAKRLLVRKEERCWATYALSCASFADELPGLYELLSQQGERTFCKALSCCLELHDRDLAEALYQNYRQAKERDNDPWEPETKTEQLWRKVLALDEDEVV